MTEDEISDKLGPTKYLEQYFFELYLILDKLIDDGYAKKHLINRVDLNTNETKKNVVHYEITLSGKSFLHKGGYVGDAERINAENIRLEKIERNQRRNQNWMTLLTAAFAFGTLVSAFYYLIEIWRFFYC
jgi:hypothetical protein